MKLVYLYRVILTGLFICASNARGEQYSNNVEQRVNGILSQMTLQEKLDYIHGVPVSPGFPNSTGASIGGIPRVGLPEIRTTDGPQGVRVPFLPSTAHPGGIVVAASWNPKCAWDRGVGIGRDCRSRGFHIWLGPGVNIYRVPVGGRNSGYCSGEDPYLGSQLAVPLV